MKISGIYKIINKINGKYYVGSSIDIHRRWKRHLRNLINNTHSNPHLQNAWNKYGQDEFKFIVVEKIDIINLLNKEQVYLNYCKIHAETNYNISYNAIAPMTGRYHSDFTKQIISKKFTGNLHPLFGTHLSKQTKQQIGIANSKRVWTDVSKQKISDIHKGKSLTLKHKIQISNANKGKYISPETRKKISNSKLGTMIGIHNHRFGKCHITETKIKMSMSHKDFTIFTIKNIITAEKFSGDRYSMKEKLGVGKDTICRFLNQHRKSCKGWVLSSN